VLRDRSIDAVLILTPPSTHLELVRRAAAAGKHILLEKPLETTVDRAERVVEACPELILLDLMMPEMDGFEFIGELRQNPAWRTIPIVVITAIDLTVGSGASQRIRDPTQKGAYSRQALLQEVRDLVASCLPKPVPTSIGEVLSETDESGQIKNEKNES
jgi:CheY-like chemotaxis protein